MPSAPLTKAKQRAARLLQQQQHAYEQNVFNSYRRNGVAVSSSSGGGNATTNTGFGNPSGGGKAHAHFPPTVRKSSVANISVDIERNVECVLSRKRAEMIESSGMHEKQRRVLRVYLFNTHNNDQVNNNNEGEENSLQATGKTKKVLKFTFGKRKTTASESSRVGSRRRRRPSRKRSQTKRLLLLLLLVRLTATGRKRSGRFTCKDAW